MQRALMVLGLETPAGLAVAEAAATAGIPVVGVSLDYRALNLFEMHHPRHDVRSILGSVIDERSTQWLAADVRRLTIALSAIVAPIVVASADVAGVDSGSDCRLAISQHLVAATQLASLAGSVEATNYYVAIVGTNAAPFEAGADRQAPPATTEIRLADLQRERSTPQGRTVICSVTAPPITDSDDASLRLWRAAVGPRILATIYDDVAPPASAATEDAGTRHEFALVAREGGD